jgi:riboflavin kinase/FMN adenylyltransferase
MTLSNEYLGYDYFLTGTVIQGKLGRTINFPTANLKSQNYKLIPKNGVYIVQSILNEKTVFGMMNHFIPLLTGTNQSIEIHFLISMLIYTIKLVFQY